MQRKGFTLVELIVVTGIIGVLTLLISTIVVRGFETYRFNRESASYQEQALKAMNDFEKTARGATQVFVSDASNFEFLVYMPKDDYPAPSRVRYFYKDKQFKRGVIAPQGNGPVYSYPLESEEIATVSFNVANGDIFSYLNDASVEIADPAPIDAVRMVKISLTVDRDQDKPPLPVNEETSINLRNLKTNL